MRKLSCLIIVGVLFSMPFLYSQGGSYATKLAIADKYFKDGNYYLSAQYYKLAK